MGWRWEELSQTLSMSTLVQFSSIFLSTLVQLSSIFVRPERHYMDSYMWLDGSKDFSVKAAYKLARNLGDDIPCPGWERIWKMKIQ